MNTSTSSSTYSEFFENVGKRGIFTSSVLDNSKEGRQYWELDFSDEEDYVSEYFIINILIMDSFRLQLK